MSEDTFRFLFFFSFRQCNTVSAENDTLIHFHWQYSANSESTRNPQQIDAFFFWSKTTLQYRLFFLVSGRFCGHGFAPAKCQKLKKSRKKGTIPSSDLSSESSKTSPACENHGKPSSPHKEEPHHARPREPHGPLHRLNSPPLSPCLHCADHLRTMLPPQRPRPTAGYYRNNIHGKRPRWTMFAGTVAGTAAGTVGYK